MARSLYRFYWDCGRQGDVDGIFIAEKADLESAIGKQVYFGEILGKHSEVYGQLDAEDVDFITDEQSVIDIVDKYNLENGFNPLHYIQGDEE